MVMHDASDSKATAGLAGRVYTTGDHAASFEAPESPSGAGGNDHVHHAAHVPRARAARGQQIRCLREALQVDSVVGTSAELYLEVRHHQGMKANAVGVRVRETCEREVVLRFTYRLGGRNPVRDLFLAWSMVPRRARGDARPRLDPPKARAV